MSGELAHSSANRILHRFYPQEVPDASSVSDIPELSHSIFPSTSYTDNEKIEIGQWLTTATRFASTDEDQAKQAERLGSLNLHLSTRTTLLGSKPSIADPALYASLAPLVKNWVSEERTGEHGYHHVVRYVDFVQNAPLFHLGLKDDEKVAVDLEDVIFVHKPLDPKEEKERKKKEKALAAAEALKANPTPLVVGQGKPQEAEKGIAGAVQDGLSNAKEMLKGVVAGDAAKPQPKREKKEKAAKAPKPAPKETALSPCLIDLRVGHILKAVAHPNADSLYVSTIAVGDPAGTDNTSEYEGQTVRTVCSGLNGLIPLEELQNRKIVAVCNLKPVTMRGIKSAAMVLAASPRLAEGEADQHAGPVELVSPPPDSKAGERVYFEGWQGEPEGVLNPKKKVWEMIQPGFTTTEGLGVAFDLSKVEQLQGELGAGKPGMGRLVVAGGGACTVKSLTAGIVR